MKKQKIIDNTDWYKFNTEIRNLILEGWILIPESTRVAMAMGQYSIFERYFAVMEKES